jgi:Ni,Fe-hydrogenase III small subunit
VILYSFGHEPLVVTSANVKVGTAQLSVAVGVAQDGVAEHSMVEGPGNPEITGGVVSSTLMVWDAVAVFPQPSSAVQVRVMLYSFGHDPLVVTSAKVNVGTPQLSVAVGTSNEGVPPHSIVVTPGNPEMTGGVVSSTFIVCDAVAVFPQPSSAVHVRVMLYSFGHDPLVVTSANVNVGVPQLSVAVGVVQDGTPEHSMFEGPGNPEMTGGTVSSTLTVCEAVAVLPQPSSAVQVRVMLYSFGQVPFVVTSAKVSVGTPQLSVAVGVVQDGVPEHSIVVALGNPEMTGGTVSSTFIVCAAVAVLPQPSSAVQVRVMLYSFGQVPLTVISTKFKVGVPQLSVTVGVVHDGVPEHSILDGPGNPDITGGVVSSTLIV